MPAAPGTIGTREVEVTGGPLDEAQIEFLSRQRIAHLATADAHGQPHVVPVCFALVGQTVYSLIDAKPKRGSPLGLRRIRNILQNPRVAIVADVYDDQRWERLGFVLLSGTARLIEAGAEHALALEALRERYVQYRSMPVQGRPIIAVTLEHAVSWGQLGPGP